MTDEEFNKVTKELDVVLLDVNYKNFETPLDVAKVCITLGKINERFLAKENAEIKTQNEKLKCCGNCKHWRYTVLEEDYICKRNEEIQKTMECYKEKMDKCDKWELAE